MPTTNGIADLHRVALGLKDRLKPFAARHGAETWKDLAKGDTANWKYYILMALNDPKTEVFFNLQGVDVEAGLLRAASVGATSTDWELLMIYQNPDW